jgi:hypothetical protein
MVDGLAAGNVYGGGNFDILQNSIGETVTIYTTSGGQSGYGFTGVVIAVNQCFVRLITHIGPAPACALGSCCGVPGGGYGTGNVRTVGSVTDIPLDRIAAIVSNAV